MTINLRKKKWDLLEKCQQFTEIMFWNACTWHDLEDLIFYGQWTNLHDQSQNGPKPVTNTWIDWFHTFIMQVNTGNVVMWETMQNNADWDCFKTPTSREILKFRNPLLEEHCAFSVAITFVPVSWMCKKLTSVSHSSTASDIIYFLGCRIKDGRYTRTWFMGSDRHSSSRKHASKWWSTRRPV